MKLLTAKYKPWVVYAGCTLAALSIATSNLRGGFWAQYVESSVMVVLSPLYRSVNYVLDTSVEAVRNYIILTGIRQENSRLRDELAQAHRQLTFMEEYRFEADRYRSMLGLSTTLNKKNLVAEVVQRDLETWNTVLIINAGTLKGVVPSTGVITDKGVVGQVIRSAPGASKVITMIHPRCGIAGILEKSRITGIVTGTGDGQCIMKYASHFDRVVLGERVLTSGFDNIFEKGIPVGQVARIEKIPGEIFQRVSIIPFVDFAEVEDVILMIPGEPEILE